MVNVAGRKLWTIVISVVMTSTLWVGWPVSSWADKIPQPLVFDPAIVGAAVISVYKTEPSTHPDTVKAVLKSSKSYYKKVPGLVSFSVLSSLDSDRILALTEWDNETSYAEYQTALATASTADYSQYYEKYAKDKPSSDEPIPAPQETVVYTIDRTVAPPGFKAVIAGENSVVQVRELSATDSGAALLTQTTQVLDELPSLYPSPRSMVLLRGTTQPNLALLANWGNFSEMGDLAQLPRLPLGTVAEGEAAIVAETAFEVAAVDLAQPSLELSPEPASLSIMSDDHLYQVVKVISPKAEKYSKD